MERINLLAEKKTAGRGPPFSYRSLAKILRSSQTRLLVSRGSPRSASALPAVAASAATASAAPAATPSAKARLTRLGLVHLDISALELGIVELLNRLTRLLRGRHLDKAETLRLA